MGSERSSDRVRIERIEVAAYTIPTDRLESDGTLEWDRTTLVVVHASGGGRQGLGYTYANRAAANVVRDTLAEVVMGQDVMNVPAVAAAMAMRVRNDGRSGVIGMAMAAIDAALWDLKAKILDLPLVTLLGAVRERSPIYGSGGFTSYSASELERELAGSLRAGITRVKMKVGRNPAADPARVHLTAGAVDVLQADASRCGITGFLHAGIMSAAEYVGFSAHCAPSLHAHPACAVPELRHIEYFHDHVRIEEMLFDGAARPVAGHLTPDRSRPGLGLALKQADAARFA